MNPTGNSSTANAAKAAKRLNRQNAHQGKPPLDAHLDLTALPLTPSQTSHFEAGASTGDQPLLANQLTLPTPPKPDKSLDSFLAQGVPPPFSEEELAALFTCSLEPERSSEEIKLIEQLNKIKLEIAELTQSITELLGKPKSIIPNYGATQRPNLLVLSQNLNQQGRPIMQQRLNALKVEMAKLTAELQKIEKKD